MTATESHARDPRTYGGADTVHSAVHSPQDSTGAAPNARPRTRVRENSGGSAQSQPQSALDFEALEDAPEVTKGDSLRGVAAGFSPPDIWSTDRPALRSVWAYAARGDWTREDGAPRRVGQAYALLIALPVVGAAYAIAWAAERGTRLTALIVLIALLAQVPPLAWLL